MLIFWGHPNMKPKPLDCFTVLQNIKILKNQPL